MSKKDTFPEWPRGLSVRMAAHYTGVSENMFREEVKAGVWPQPIRRGGRVVWDRQEIDKRFDAMSGVATTSGASIVRERLNRGNQSEAR